MSEFRKQLLEEFKDKEFRDAYADEYLSSLIATQIKVLREERGLTQEQLAELADMSQSRISALEDVTYSSWSIKTLKRLSQALDVVLTVHFDSFGRLIESVEEFSRESLQVPSFSDDVLLYGRPEDEASQYQIFSSSLAGSSLAGTIVSRFEGETLQSRVQTYILSAYEEQDKISETPIPVRSEEVRAVA